ncbi:MAG: glycosyltransferase family 4 protein [Paracoccus sp. (in: a-proteobacteria)]
MRVLLSAYACEPGLGSEPGKGWLFAEALTRQGCDVVVLTCGSHHRAAIEAHLADQPPNPRMTFVWHDVPGWPGPGYVDAHHIRQHYMAWQLTARNCVRKLLKSQKIDVIHHLTWTVLRWPSFLGGLGPRFIFGPVGGGETTPAALRVSLSAAAQRRERLRDLLNAVSRFDPMVRSCLDRADVILVTDPATRDLVPSRHQKRTFVIADILAPEPQTSVSDLPVRRGHPALLFAGRLEGWKGAHLAIMALARLRMRMPEAQLTIAGTGPEAVALRQLTVRLGLHDDAVRFAGLVPRTAMAQLYAQHDLFLFPSLHDSGPHVIGEALAAGLPVVCLDLGGPGVAIDASCGAAVASHQADPVQLSSEIADAIVDIVRNPARLIELRRAARAKAQSFTPDRRAQDMITRFYTATADAPRHV